MAEILTHGVVIAIEGIDCAGKLTQCELLRAWLESHLGRVVFWSEPNDTTSLIGKQIRAMLNREMERESDPVEFQRMYVIDRAQSVFCFLRPNIKAGVITLLDRYALSTIAYGMLSGFPAEVFIQLHRNVLGPSMVWPDLSVIIDISADTAIERLKERAKNTDGPKAGRQADFFERADHLARVRENYLVLAKRTDIGGVAVVNGEQSAEAVFETIKKVIEPLLHIRA